MPQPKGKTGNPNGRPKGTPNKTTKAIRNWLVELINNNRQQIESDFKALDPKERLAMLEKFLPYLLPKVERADEVEGACFTKEDVEKKDFADFDLADYEVKEWFEKP